MDESVVFRVYNGFEYEGPIDEPDRPVVNVDIGFRLDVRNQIIGNSKVIKPFLNVFLVFSGASDGENYKLISPLL